MEEIYINIYVLSLNEWKNEKKNTYNYIIKEIFKRIESTKSLEREASSHSQRMMLWLCYPI